MQLFSRISKLHFATIIFFLFSCASKKAVVSVPEPDYEDYREELLDTLVVSDYEKASDLFPKVYRPSATLKYDLLHTKLEVSFDWAKQHVLGKATLELKPYFYPIDTVILDAKYFDIHKVQLLNNGKNLNYQYDSLKLAVILDRKYNRQEKLSIYIDYTAKPNRTSDYSNEAITSDKGLFFINPDGSEPGKPTQIWTQGETENNSRWFPTFDKPNERCTQEIYITVEDKYKTLSNGRRISSRKNADGTRTDYWKQEKAHAPYLFMVAVGEFEEVEEFWNDLPLHYFVEKGFGKHAKKIFNHTPEMLSFFSGKFQYPYPWDKYAQVVVRDFVSGAMENTGAVVFGEFVQKTDRELIDDDNDYIVAHEMSHHWFGNLVTCEDWSNLTLNEGFANYSEYLWLEHKYGRDRAEFHRMNELNGYFGQVFNQGARPLIHYFYEDKEQMFDAHSYNKGGLILHMLRDYVGDEAFFAALNYYLTKHAYTAVEVDELRMAFEDVTGEDLHWFFNQWFLGSGHPVINVKYEYNAETRAMLIETEQLQSGEGQQELFILPVTVALYFKDGSVAHYPRTINSRSHRILIEDLPGEPAVAVLDGNNVLCGLINEFKTESQYEAQFLFSPHFIDKVSAFSNLESPSEAVLTSALKHPNYYIRTLGIGAISEENQAGYEEKLKNLATKDPHSRVRADALSKLLEIESFDPTDLCSSILEKEQAYPVIDIALTGLNIHAPDKALAYAEKMMDDDSDYLAGTIAEILGASDDVKYLSYFEKKARTIGLYQVFDFYTRYQNALEGKNIETLVKTAEVMKDIATNENQNIFRKFMATTTIARMKADLENRDNPIETFMPIKIMEGFILEIKSREKNALLAERYKDIF